MKDSGNVSEMTQYQEKIHSRRRMASYWLTGLGLIMVFTIFHGHEWRGGA